MYHHKCDDNMQDYDTRSTLPSLQLGEVGRRLQQALVEHLDEGALPFNGVPRMASKPVTGDGGFPPVTARPQHTSHWAATPPHSIHGFSTERNKASWHSPSSQPSGYTTPGGLGPRGPPPVRTTVLHGGSPMSVHDYSSPTNSTVSTNTNTSYGVSTPHSGMAQGVPSWHPMTAPACVRQYGAYLTEFEQSEVFDYRNVYFFGKDAKKVRGTTLSPNANYGYDDEKGDYRVVSGDHVAYRYEVLSVLGKGSFGQVMQVFDHKFQCKLALKIIRNKKRFHHQAMVEVDILQRLLDADPFDTSNVVRMHSHFTFRNHLCIVFELLHLNLYDHLKAQDFAGLPVGALRHVATQMLRSLLFCRAQGIVHCDIKPENILLKNEWSYDVKLIDFGSSCYEGKTMYTYIQSRFYRAPEVILGLPYGGPIDVWSLACVLAELCTGTPLFPGENEHQQLLCMMEILGLPPQYLVQAAPRANVFFDTGMQPLIVPNARGLRRYPGSTDLRTAVGCTDPALLSFLQACLVWDAGTRLTVEQALQHPFITGQPMPTTRRGAGGRAPPQVHGNGRHKAKPLGASTDHHKRRKPSNKGVAPVSSYQAAGGYTSTVLPYSTLPVTYSGAFWNDTAV